MIKFTSDWLVVSPGSLVSSTNKSDRNDITEILLKVALNTIKQTNKNLSVTKQFIYVKHLETALYISIYFHYEHNLTVHKNTLHCTFVKE